MLRLGELVTDGYRLSLEVKRNRCGHEFKDGDELQAVMTGRLLIQNMEFCEQGLNTLSQVTTVASVLAMARCKRIDKAGKLNLKCFYWKRDQRSQSISTVN